jgi:group I intron endonuclease
MLVVGIYKIVRSGSDACYIGSSQNIRARWSQHQRSLRLGVHASAKLQNAWNKYGEAAFQFTVIEVCSTEILLQREQYYLDTLKPVFNCALYAGAPMRGRKQSDKQKVTIRALMIGNTYRLGYKHSAERKAQMSEFMRKRVHASGWSHSMEAKTRIAVAMRGRQHRLGQRHSAETRAKMSRSRTGHPVSAETRTKLSITHRQLYRSKLEGKFPLVSGSV